jgi:DnaJ-class molecular chaperone
VTRRLTVRIPSGADDGSTLRIAGKGSPGAHGGPPGDLVIETRVRPHPLLRRDGLDLHLKLPVTLDEIYDGAQVEVPTFEGPVKLTIPARSQPGARLRLRGKGLKRGPEQGDLYAELELRLPERHDEQLADAFRKARTAYAGPVRKEMRL